MALLGGFDVRQVCSVIEKTANERFNEGNLRRHIFRHNLMLKILNWWEVDGESLAAAGWGMVTEETETGVIRIRVVSPGPTEFDDSNSNHIAMEEDSGFYETQFVDENAYEFYDDGFDGIYEDISANYVSQNVLPECIDDGWNMSHGKLNRKRKLADDCERDENLCQPKAKEPHLDFENF